MRLGRRRGALLAIWLACLRELAAQVGIVLARGLQRGL
jgi:hypothetical protein